MIIPSVSPSATGNNSLKCTLIRTSLKASPFIAVSAPKNPSRPLPLFRLNLKYEKIVMLPSESIQSSLLYASWIVSELDAIFSAPLLIFFLKLYHPCNLRQAFTEVSSFFLVQEHSVFFCILTTLAQTEIALQVPIFLEIHIFRGCCLLLAKRGVSNSELNLKCPVQSALGVQCIFSVGKSCFYVNVVISPTISPPN